MKRPYNNRLSLAKVWNFRQAGQACLALFALLLLTSVALAQGGYDLSWWTVDGGGYTFSEGGSYSLGGTIGQPDTGPALTGSDYTLVGGFWSGAEGATGPGMRLIYLPLVMKGHCSCGPDNYEPNDSFAQAYGPLTSGQAYQSYISCCDVASQRDYFYINISTTNPIEVDLTDIPAGVDYDLYLYNSVQDEVGRSQENGNLPEHILYDPPSPGRYYILVFSPYAHYSASPYWLRVTYD